MISKRVLRHPGNYRANLAYQKSAVIYDCTVVFCNRFLNKFDRNNDQMIQAARSGKQNIVEGAKGGMVSLGSELKLTGVARASLTELLEDYLDFLRVRSIRAWEKSDKESLFVRKIGRDLSDPDKHEESRGMLIEMVKSKEGDYCANLILCLLYQTLYLLNRKILALEKEFVNEGGVRERMTKIKREQRQR